MGFMLIKNTKGSKMLILSGTEFTKLLEQLNRVSGWDIANVCATFAAVIVALFFPLREYIRTFARFSLKAKIPEIREANLDSEKRPHVSLSIRNLSRETLTIKDIALIFTLHDYRNFNLCFHLQQNCESKLLPLSEEELDFLFIDPKDAYKGFNHTKHILQTNKQILEHYLSDITGFEEVKKISLMVRTNLGTYRKKLPKCSYIELFDQVGTLIVMQDKKHQRILDKYTKNKNAKQFQNSFKNYLKDIDKFYADKKSVYQEKCQKGREKEQAQRKFKKCKRFFIRRDKY